MPHDKNGKKLEAGDKVVIHATVKSVSAGEEYCNATIETDPMPPYTDPFSITLNTKQLEKLEG